MAEGQPDGDFSFLLEAEEGLPLGLLEDLPRTSTMFERQTKRALEEAPVEQAVLCKPNYPSAEVHRNHLRMRLEGGAAEGLVEKMTMQAFEKEFGEEAAISALAVLVKDETTGGSSSSSHYQSTPPPMPLFSRRGPWSGPGSPHWCHPFHPATSPLFLDLKGPPMITNASAAPILPFLPGALLGPRRGASQPAIPPPGHSG